MRKTHASHLSQAIEFGFRRLQRLLGRCLLRLRVFDVGFEQLVQRHDARRRLLRLVLRETLCVRR